jgi:N-dimethylarginine dimethylaminohydrolase
MSALGSPTPQPSTPPPLLTFQPAPRVPSFLLCPPPHFGVHYVINPWMSGHIGGTSADLASSQWCAFRDILAGWAAIELLPAVPGLPDLVFTANAAVLRGNRAVLSSFRYPERQQEEPHLAAWLTAQGYDVLTLPRKLHLEGAGDALFHRGASTPCTNLLWFGHGVRSSIDALPFLEQHLGVAVQPLRLADKRFYHLDTCFCPLDRGYLLYYPAAFVLESIEIIEAMVPASHRYAVSDEDAEDFACNAVNMAGQVILNRASAPLKQWLGEKGFAVHETAATEFLKAGGSIKCMTLRLDEA